ncbi:ABC-2 type transport system permease protein [Fontibacillus phaseoli]|uniref:ABC-2 type transport system permease protein n=1 Tax=Fontibacillus phaseoli TaxID=1416533 RepID=A0A369BFL9_9BACL|nr:ABC-2 family transporter protein [Fontibacillus phaseoli]RCX20332.1 ABC-2 type transport system permease protein [Fontibacillus phaseoli]
MLYFTLASKAYARNLQYRGAHMVHNLASAMFGFMYACIWIGLGRDHPLGDYGTQGMVGYIAFTQAVLWVTSFISNGLGIPQSVRTGQISLDLMRPVHLFSHMMAREWGQIAYQFLYKSIPIYLLYFFLFSLRLPDHGITYLFTFLGLSGAAYLSICMNYLIGVSALWTTESSWLYWGNHAMINLLAGFFIPLEWLPRWLENLAWMSPYPYLLYVPTTVYLGHGSGRGLWGTLFWGVLMTVLCLLATRIVRRKVEVQGG